MNYLSRIPAVVLAIVAMISVNAGAGVAKTLFTTLTPSGVVFLRVFFATLVLIVVTRPDWRSLKAKQWRSVALFGFALAAMNYCYYQSLQLLPLGLAVTIEFIGPLAVALWQSHRVLDWLWVILAAIGLALLNPFTGQVNPVGIAFAVAAGACWATYIVIGQKLGKVLPGAQGLCLSMIVATICLLPISLSDAVPAFSQPQLLLIAAAVAVFSSVIPYSLEIETLRRMDTRSFGILLSLEPAIAAIIGYILLSESLTLLQWFAIVLVSVASYGSVRFARS